MSWIKSSSQFDGETSVRSTIVYNGKLYGGTSPNGKLYEWNGIDSWAEVAHRLGSETTIHSLVVYNNKLYGSTYPNGKLYEWNGIDSWAEVAHRLGSEIRTYSLTVYNNKLYAATAPHGKLYEWNGVDSWIEVASQLNNVKNIESLIVYDGKLYGGTSPNGGLYEWNGVDSWIEVASQLGNQTNIHSLEVYNDKLYGGTYPNGKLYEWNGIDSWIEVAPKHKDEISILALAVFNGKLCSGTYPNGKLYEWNGIDSWAEITPRLENETRINSLISYNDKLYGATFPCGKLYEWDNTKEDLSMEEKLDNIVIGEGCTNLYYIDKDCDGYGVSSPNGPDADDTDPSVNTSQSMLDKYGSLSNFLHVVKGYDPLHYYFIDVENGNDDTGEIDSETTPFKTWHAVHPIVKAGDIVIYRAGVHNVPITLIYPSASGTEEDPIIFMSYPGELAIFDRPAAGINIMHSDYIIIDGLTCRNSVNGLGRGVMIADSCNVRIVNVDSGNSTSGLFAMRLLHNFHVENCVFRNTCPKGTHCAYLGGRFEANRDIVFRNNILYNCGMNAFQYNGAATNMIFENNILHSSNMAAISLLMGVSDSIFRNNLGFNNSQGVIIYNYVTPLGPPGDQKNNLFVNNTFWTGKYNHTTGEVGPVGAASIHFNDYIKDPDTGEPIEEYKRSFDDNVFRNNIFVTSAGPTFRFDQEDFLDTTVIENNIIFRYGDYRYEGSDYVLNYGGGYYTNYDFESFKGFSDLIKNNVYTWPEFDDVSIDYATTPKAFNFKLSSGSPAVDLGTNSEAPDHDLIGVIRSGNPDAGCYEYSSDVIDGDITGDNILDINDYSAILATLGKQVWEPKYNYNADYNNDGRITYSDFKTWYNYYKATR